MLMCPSHIPHYCVRKMADISWCLRFIFPDSCVVSGKKYAQGDEMLFPNISDPLNAICKTCTCSGGSARNCWEYFCDSGLSQARCEKWSVPDGHCCPKCGKE